MAKWTKNIYFFMKTCLLELYNEMEQFVSPVDFPIKYFIMSIESWNKFHKSPELNIIKSEES